MEIVFISLASQHTHCEKPVWWHFVRRPSGRDRQSATRTAVHTTLYGRDLFVSPGRWVACASMHATRI